MGKFSNKGSFMFLLEEWEGICFYLRNGPLTGNSITWFRFWPYFLERYRHIIICVLVRERDKVFVVRNDPTFHEARGENGGGVRQCSKLGSLVGLMEPNKEGA